MSKKADISLIKELSLAFGPTGVEDEVAKLIDPKISRLADSVKLDRMGDLIARMTFGNGSKKLMVSAHMDEVGFMVTEICEDGYLRFDTVGGISGSVLAGRRITLLGKEGKVNGLIASKAIHHKSKEEREKVLDAEKLYIDIGASSKEEAERYVEIGSEATFDSEFVLFGTDNRLVKSKALDDRMGCAAMIEVMESLAQDRPNIDLDVYFCFTVREEIGLSGALTAANAISPDFALVLETTAIGDIADTSPEARVADVGGGGVLSLMDRSTIYDRSFVEFLLKTSKKNGIKAQIKRYVSGGNDAGSIHKTGVGVRTAALSVPTRYLHSPACVASLDDYEALRDLCEAAVRNFDTKL
jgi:endoglucanase